MSPNRRNKLTKEDKEKIIKDYKDNIKILKIQEKYQISHSTIYDILKEYKEGGEKI